MNQENKITNEQVKPANKIKRIQKVNVESTAANQHNSYLNVQDADRLKQMMSQGNEQSITDGIIEWYFRTIADEIYKLSFINEKKFNRIKMFWPSQYQEFLSTKQIGRSDIKYYLNQFKGFDIEDYLDVFVFPQVIHSQFGITITFILAWNQFTMINDSNCRIPIEIDDGLHYFYKTEHKVYDGALVLNALTMITNQLIERICFKNQTTKIKIKYTDQQILERIMNLLEEKTRLVLFELYDV